MGRLIVCFGCKSGLRQVRAIPLYPEQTLIGGFGMSASVSRQLEAPEGCPLSPNVSH